MKWIKINSNEDWPPKIGFNYHIKVTYENLGHNWNDTAIYCGKGQWDFEHNKGQIVKEWLDESIDQENKGDDYVASVRQDEAASLATLSSSSGNSVEQFDFEQTDYTNSEALAKDVWLFLTDDSMPDKKLIKKEAFLHEVGAMLESVIQFNKKPNTSSTVLTQIELLENFGVMVLITVANDMQTKNPKWRYGQCLFNALHVLDSKLANEIRATDKDCFYQNDKIGKFLIEVERKFIYKTANTRQIEQDKND